jgi:hypothetical protein
MARRADGFDTGLLDGIEHGARRAALRAAAVMEAVIVMAQPQSQASARPRVMATSAAGRDSVGIRQPRALAAQAGRFRRRS